MFSPFAVGLAGPSVSREPDSAHPLVPGAGSVGSLGTDVQPAAAVDTVSSVAESPAGEIPSASFLPAESSGPAQQRAPRRRRCAGSLAFRCLRKIGIKAMEAVIVAACLTISAATILSTVVGVYASIRPAWLGVVLGVPYAYAGVVYLTSYLQAIATDAGRPPLPRELPPHLAGVPTCARCGLSRPPRTHHCSVCNRCTLKMDHHCPWIAGCVGFYNYGYFLRFVLWGTAGSLLSFLLNVVAIACGVYFAPFTSGKPVVRLSLYVVGCVIPLVSALCAGIIVGTNYRPLRDNLTAIEEMALEASPALLNVYNLGPHKNLQQVFGRRVALALATPCRIRPVGNGMDFPLNCQASGLTPPAAGGTL